MAMVSARKLIKKFKSRLRKKSPSLVAVAAIVGVGLIMYSGYMSNKRMTVDPSTYEPLLRLIAKAESNDNYNAYFGNPGNHEIDFTSMSIAEVLDWQASYVSQGAASSAVGRYQIINTTLEGLVTELDLDMSSKFDEAMQDRMAIALLERRGSVDYVNNELTREEFAANLSKEWAALPKVIGDNPSDSYYAGDGLNRSRVRVGEILAVIDLIDV